MCSSDLVRDPDASKLGAALLGSFLGMLVIIYTVNNYLSVPYIYFGLAALMVAYCKVALAGRFQA